MSEERADLREEMSEVRAALLGEMSEMGAEVLGEMSELRAKVDSQLPRFLWANVPIMFGVAGLVLAGAKLA